MEADGFFGNWAKYSMENRMNTMKQVDYAIEHPDLYSKEQLASLLRDLKNQITDSVTVKKEAIYDESGFQIGTAAPLNDPLRKSDYFTCAAGDKYTLEHQVNKMVKVGYKPVGGLTIFNGNFYQALFLDKKDLEKKDAADSTIDSFYNKDYSHF